MKITIEVKDPALSSLVSYSQLTDVPVHTLIDEALADFVACVLPARLETIEKNPTLIGCNLYVV